MNSKKELCYNLLDIYDLIDDMIMPLQLTQASGLLCKLAASSWRVVGDPPNNSIPHFLFMIYETVLYISAPGCAVLGIMTPVPKMTKLASWPQADSRGRSSCPACASVEESPT